jgi:mannose-6-phosphate isomerase-like protein (cupin superfamily)
VREARRTAVVVTPQERRRTGNVEFLALTEHTPHFNLAIITMAPHRHGPEAHVHNREDDSFYVLDGEITFWVDGEEIAAPAGTFVLVPPGLEHTFANETAAEARILNVHAPAGFDKRLLEED